MLAPNASVAIHQFEHWAVLPRFLSGGWQEQARLCGVDFKVFCSK